MKKLFLLLALPLLATTMQAGGDAKNEDCKRVRPNYALAERFSPNKIGRMVKSTSINPHWFSDGKRFWYSWTYADGTRYYIVDTKSGKKSEMWDMEKLAAEITEKTGDPYDAQHLPIQHLQLREDRYIRMGIQSKLEIPKQLKRWERNDSTKIAKIKKENQKENKYFHFEYDLETGKLIERTNDEIEDLYPSYPGWANVSPDGKYAIYEKNWNLWYMSMEDVEKLRIWDKDSTVVEHQLTKNGRPGKCYAWHPVGTEKVDSTARFGVNALWSPDSRHFVMLHQKDSMLKNFWVINSLSSPRPTLETYKYQMPGEPGPIVTMELFDFENKSSKFINIAKFKEQTVALFNRPSKLENMYERPRKRVWLGTDKEFYFERTSRDLKKIEVCRVSVDTDSAITIVHEEMNTSIESRQIRMVNNGKNFIQWSERTGWAMLYLYDLNGNLLNPITEGAFHVDEVVAVNDKEKKVYFTAHGYNKDENPYYCHLFSVGYDGKGLKQLDKGDLNGRFHVAEDGSAFVANSSRVDTVPTSIIYNASGKQLSHLETADLSRLFDAGYKYPERFKVKAADGITDLYGVMYKPFDFDSTKCYPLIEYVYPGPQTEAVNESWSSGMNRIDRLAQMGFIVITIGNRGGHPNRSKWYHNFGYGNLRDYGLADKKVAAQQLIARHSFIDGERVGIHGHSGGGFMSTAAILFYPDFFKAAVSCAGNHDNRIYNRWWSEKHHGIKENINETDTTFAYRISNNQELASRLKGHLMLVTGDMDNNVNPANTIRVINALIRANKRFDILLLPGQRHSFSDMDEYFFWKMADHFSRYLLGESKTEVDIKEINND